jgi:RNA 3'-terminal phosphate cyclase
MAAPGGAHKHREAIMRKAISKEEMALLKEAGEMFNETGCVPGNDGEQVPAERMVPDAKEYILESIVDPEAVYDSEIWGTPGFTLVLFWLAQKWHQRCGRLADRRSSNPEQYLTKEQQKSCLDSAAVELIREITHQPSVN